MMILTCMLIANFNVFIKLSPNLDIKKNIQTRIYEYNDFIFVLFYVFIFVVYKYMLVYCMSSFVEVVTNF